MEEAGGGYAKALDELASSRPRVARALFEAERLRVERLRLYLPGQRLAGLEELFVYLEAVREAYTAEDGLSKLAFLITRAIADFETALEATLSGYQGVAADAMRDVMEIEYLLLDFAAHPEHADEWLTCDRRPRLRKFAPAKIRARLSAAGLPPFSDEGWEPVDYQAHSESLHVTPDPPVVGARGIESHPDESFLADAGFMEMFEHAWRLLQALELLRITRKGEPLSFEPLTPMDDFFDARARTGEMLLLVTATLEAPAVLGKRLGRAPTHAEVLTYVRDELSANSPRRDENSDA